MKKIICLMLCIFLMFSSLSAFALEYSEENTFLLQGDFSINTELKVENGATWYPLSEAVTSGSVYLRTDVKIQSDDMYGGYMTILSRDGVEIVSISLGDSTIAHSGGDPKSSMTLVGGSDRNFIMELTINLNDKKVDFVCNGVNKTLTVEKEFLDVSGFTLTPGGQFGIGRRHVKFDNLVVVASEDADLEDNISEAPSIEEEIVLTELFRQDYSTFRNGQNIAAGVTAIASPEGNVYAELKSSKSEAYTFNLPKAYSEGIYTFAFDYMIETDSDQGFQIQIGACLNIGNGSVQADQEKLDTQNRFVTITPSADLVAGNWYTVVLTIDPVRQLYDVYYGDERAESGLRFRNSATTSLSKVYIVPTGGTKEGLRHIKFDNFILYQGGRYLMTVEEAAELRKQRPAVKQLDTTKDVQKMKDAFAFVVGNPYMLMGDSRALYDSFDNSVVPIETEDDILIPAELVHEVISTDIPIIEFEGRKYCTLTSVTDTTGLRASQYEDMYIISKSKKPFSDGDVEYVNLVRKRIPEVLPVEKPEVYDFKTIFNNDMTGMGATNWAAKSELDKNDPYYQRDLLLLQVEEVCKAGIDVQALAALMGTVQVWKGRNDPFERHLDWLWETFGINPANQNMLAYFMRGGDLFEEYINKVHEYGQKAFISMRVNDYHHLKTATTKNPVPYAVSEFYYNNHEKMALTGSTVVLNWQYPEVREFMLNKIRDLCENYDIDGLELDFLRYCRYFPDNTPVEERIPVMTEFVEQVRKILDNTAIDGKYRYLQARVDGVFEHNIGYGLDLNALSNAGVDCFVASPFYSTSSQTDVQKIRSAIGEDKFLAVEVTNCAYEEENVSGTEDGTIFARLTPEQIYTVAYRSLNQGADGIASYNFQYYREFGGSREQRGPWNEPPFEVLEKCVDMDFISSQPMHYWVQYYVGPNTQYRANAKINKNIIVGSRSGFELDIAVPKEKLGNDSKVRFYFSKFDDDVNYEFKVTFNGTELQETSDVSLHYETEFSQADTDGTWRAFSIPAGVLKHGENIFDITLIKGKETCIKRADILIR